MDAVSISMLCDLLTRVIEALEYLAENISALRQGVHELSERIASVYVDGVSYNVIQNNLDLLRRRFDRVEALLENFCEDVRGYGIVVRPRADGTPPKKPIEGLF